ncbi:TonB-dependent receptor [Dyella kyungheensis]|uniref:TonB-dependent receptor n=1 Tax=Dyella kyungheensis TaxID=1242174 RepID=A0ABS2JT12_9GAMM|nr:TonB-dependent receptor [Dyella kyungheensis]MBM7122169.1 TonB-dependent receptor [Dyella kyungheensis]
MRQAIRLGLGVAALAAACGVAAQDARNLQGISVSAAVDDPNAAPPGTASALAPSQASLSELEPQSILNRNYIQTIASPKDDYLALLELTPSAINASPNGAGFSSKSGTVRGFQDGEYDVSFDGIPFGDPGAFGHATTAFFPAPSLGEVVVDRGPGTASNLGNATFGGTVALYSAPTTDKPSGQLSTMYGSGNTWQVAGEGNTGTFGNLGTQASVNYSHLETDGLLDNAGLKQDNVLFKIKQPLGEHTTLTLVADYNKVNWNTFTAQPRKQTDRYGIDFGGLTDDPDTQGFYKYNVDDRHADFEYLQLHGDYNSWRLDNKLYTYSLRDGGPGGVDLLGNTPNQALLPHGGVPGAVNHSAYRAWGDMLRAEKDLGTGWLDSTLRAGIWAERAYQSQHEVTVDLSTMTPRTLAGTPNDQIIDTNAHSNTTQSYVEVEWRPVENLSIVPGLKHVNFDRTLDGVSNFLPVGGSGHFSTNLGAVAVNYRFSPNLSGYAQWAEGFQAPKVTILQGDGSQVNPQTTKNYQAGLVWKTEQTVADIDVYYIDFGNLVNSVEEPIGPDGSLISVYFNQGGVIYKGIEAEFTRVLGHSGFSFTANGSLNSAYSKTTGLQIANAPSSTADVGFIYDRGQFYGSFLTKYVGARYTATGETSGANYNPNARLPAYNYTNLNLGYRFMPDLRLQLSLNNLFDHRSVIQGNGAATNPTFYYLSGRNYTVQMTYTF